MQNENAGSTVQKLTFQDDNLRELSQAWGPLEHGILCDCIGCMPIKLAVLVDLKKDKIHKKKRS